MSVLRVLLCQLNVNMRARECPLRVLLCPLNVNMRPLECPLRVLLCPLNVNMRAAVNQSFTLVYPLTFRFTYSALLKRDLWKLNLNSDLVT
jgi:hypothetical protein